MTNDEIHHLLTQAGCGGTLTPAVRRFALACAEAGRKHERNNADILRQQVEDQATEIDRLRAGLSELQRHYAELCRENRPSMALHDAAIAEAVAAGRERCARAVEQYGGAWDVTTQNFARVIRALGPND